MVDAQGVRGRVYWITGIPGSGKSTIADEIKKKFPDFVIIRMDDLRKIVTPSPTYSDPERDIVYRSLVYIAKILSELGHNVIIDATANLRIWRDLARRLIPDFYEIYLKCSLSVCIERERSRIERHGAPEDIYKKGKEGWPVPGLTVPYEEPLNPEITIDTEKISVSESVKIIIDFIKGLNKK